MIQTRPSWANTGLVQVYGCLFIFLLICRSIVLRLVSVLNQLVLVAVDALQSSNNDVLDYALRVIENLAKENAANQARLVDCGTCEGIDYTLRSCQHLLNSGSC